MSRQSKPESTVTSLCLFKKIIRHHLSHISNKCISFAGNYKGTGLTTFESNANAFPSSAFPYVTLKTAASRVLKSLKRQMEGGGEWDRRSEGGGGVCDGK